MTTDEARGYHQRQIGIFAEEQVDLVTLAWLGRDDNTLDDWPALREEAMRARGPK